ncbi:glycosyltransferase [Candidatus Pelagibacter sp.]|nr:glycosyltransferase [Candidatus Pelagibacter sp.]
MKILLNLLAAKQGGQVTRAKEFIGRFQSFANKNDKLLVLTSNFFPTRIKNNRSIKVVKINFSIKSIDWLVRYIWENLKLINLIKNLKPDVYLTFSHSLPLLKLNIPTMVGVSNLAPFSYSAFIKETIFGKMRLFFLKRMIISATNKASAVIALSNEGKKFLINHGIENKKIIKILIGVKTQKKRLLNNSFNLKEKYILYVSHFYRYKNFEQLILAYSKLPKNTISKFRLKLVGNFADKRYVQSLQQISKKMNIYDKIDFISGMNSKSLDLMYKNASLFVFPSKIENCPNILLEAMSFSLPILAGKTPPMPEFSKKAANFFEIDNPQDLSKKINKLLKSKKKLNKMSKLSYARSKIYSWDLFTKNVIDICKITIKKNYK